MCLTLSHVRPMRAWNWDGDAILNDPIVPAARHVPGTQSRYDIDIRSYLLHRENAVLRRTIHAIMDGLPAADRSRFRSSRPGSFDFRATTVLEWLAGNTRHLAGTRGFDAWQFPDETIARGGGDCEDRAFLLAALLLASGISGYVVRVVLGKLYDERTDRSKDHAWVMYKNEDGKWLCLEPLLFGVDAVESDAITRAAAARRRPSRKDTVPGAASAGRKRRSLPVYEYIPCYAFNDSHLWRISGGAAKEPFRKYIDDRRFWTTYDPAFATSVHEQIVDRALPELSWSRRAWIKAVSLALDTVASYDPRDHFDNGYVHESWALLRRRVRSGTLNGLACAVHGISDLYAHTTWGCFAPDDPVTRGMQLYAPALIPQLQPRYDTGDLDLTDTQRFTVNPKYYRHTDRREAVRLCTGRVIISGRFAQPGDPAQGTLERLFVAIPYEMRNAAEFPWRGALPHHNEIAIDEPLDRGTIPHGHRVYRDPAVYARQFERRVDAAVRHAQLLHAEWKSVAGS